MHRCAVLYLDENCGDGGKELDEGAGGRLFPIRYRKSKNAVVRPGCTLDAQLHTGLYVDIKLGFASWSQNNVQGDTSGW